MRAERITTTTDPQNDVPKRDSGIRRAVRPLEVVVADDDESTRELIGRAVSKLGHRCRIAPDGRAALALLDERPADVVVSDWDMPGMTGAELCATLRSRGDDAPYTYFVILTGFDDREHLLGGMTAGADDYQRKPVNLDELEARLLSASRVVELHRRNEARTAELKNDTDRLFAASRTDALTGAGNRLRLDEEVETLLSRASRYGHRCSLAICDLDFFKHFNDTLGHVAGDEALRRVAEAMRTTLRSSDTLYRYGGEEFVVLLVEQSASDAYRAMNRMRIAIERLALPSPATGGPLTISVGIAEAEPLIDRSPADWVARADAALYEAKAAGRNRIVSKNEVAPPSSRTAPRSWRQA